MKFSAVTDADLRRMSRRKTPDLPLDEELSPEELVAFWDRVGKLDQHKWQREHSKEFIEYQKKNAAEIEERVEKRKRAADKRASFRVDMPPLETRIQMLEEDSEYESPDAFEDTWNSFQVTTLPPICSDRRQLAAWLCADPHEITWNHLTDTLFLFDEDGNRHVTPKLYKMVEECRKAASPEHAWNKMIAAMEPATMGGIRYGVPSIYRAPGLPQHTPLGIGFAPRPGAASEAEILKFMLAAEHHELPARVTKCRFSGESLVEKGTKAGKTYWRIKPNWQGMSLHMARQAVSYAAIEAGVTEGKRMGDPPPVVHELARDGDAWASLAVATNHPVFKDVARFLLMLRDRLYFSLEDPDMRANMRAWDRLAAKAAAEEANG